MQTGEIVRGQSPGAITIIRTGRQGCTVRHTGNGDFRNAVVRTTRQGGRNIEVNGRVFIAGRGLRRHRDFFDNRVDRHVERNIRAGGRHRTRFRIDVLRGRVDLQREVGAITRRRGNR